ncbi:MAG: 3-deoxy-8-phosphooctulonate synthase [Spirochaetaceae bacterium]|nr:3-deoxy-8-phosphooctulonate synthase [Spirochaetaceae bacterium]|tara:strand:- start:11438 stop:12289 length:852 start_codon:yes stop_codon:yes gene_type:complete
MQASKRPFLNNSTIGGDEPFFLIAGPCVIESRDMLSEVCETMLEITGRLGIPYVFKSSFDKANRSSADSKRGPGIDEGLRDLQYIKETYGVPVLTDVHDASQVDAVAQVVDILQIPAFLCRQTDLVFACADTGRWVNVKKGQFMAPADANSITEKIKSRGNDKYLITERGVSFGYNNLVFDPRSPEIMHQSDIPVVFDGTHSTQLPGGGKQSGGDRAMAPVLMRAAAAVGIEGFFMEVHPDPANAWSDSSNQYWLDKTEELLKQLYDIDRLVKTGGAVPAGGA